MTRLRTLSTSVAWLPWGRAGFDRARAERKPVLLSLTMEWCAWCREMDRTSYVDPGIATTINEQFVPVRVDADERPDVSDRYSLGGWPTTAFLTPDGAIAGGGTYVPQDRMPEVLARVLAQFGAHADRMAGSLVIPAAGTAEDETAGAQTPAQLCARVFASFDDSQGGFDGAPGFPLCAPLRLALALRESDPPRAAQHESVVITALDAMGWGGLYDEYQGGFFRRATAPGWHSPDTAKLLEPNASLLRLYLDAGAALGVTRFSERGADILRYLQTWLADPVDGGWSSSQHADASYYAAAPDARQAMTAPAVSGRRHADANAAMVSSALHASAMFGDDGLRDFALKSLERVLLSCYKPGAGVAHDVHGVRGLLADQVLMANACLDAFTVTGNIVYEMMAEELMHFAVRTMWRDGRGGFHDRAECPEDEAVGLMRARLLPFVTNCEAAQVLNRLAATSGDHDFAARAQETLTAVAPLAPAHGPLAAHYVLALHDAPVR